MVTIWLFQLLFLIFNFYFDFFFSRCAWRPEWLLTSYYLTLFFITCIVYFNSEPCFPLLVSADCGDSDDEKISSTGSTDFPFRKMQKSHVPRCSDWDFLTDSFILWNCNFKIIFFRFFRPSHTCSTFMLFWVCAWIWTFYTTINLFFCQMFFLNFVFLPFLAFFRRRCQHRPDTQLHLHLV